MQTGSDAELCAVLQVAREEMPEALKTLQRELERIVEEEGREGSMKQGGIEDDAVLLDDKDKERTAGILGLMRPRRPTVSTKSNAPSRRGSGGDSDGWSRDTLHREFIESGIDALRRASAGVDPASLPSWTITR
jgi:abelson tyrosine-protein kinase 1/abelson tyrosine-protein kinase 2